MAPRYGTDKLQKVAQAQEHNYLMLGEGQARANKDEATGVATVGTGT